MRGSWRATTKIGTPSWWSAFPAVAEAVVLSFVGAGDEPVDRHGHVEDGCRHGVTFLATPGYGGSPLAPARAEDSGSRVRAGWPGKHRREVLEQLEPAVERSAGNHVEGDIGITVVDPVAASAPGDHGEDDHAETVD
jgi:hypothetical protein